MATVDKTSADRLVEWKGQYPGDPPIYRIVRYTNKWGSESFGIEYEHEVGRYAESEFVLNPSTYWERKNAS